MPQLKSLIFNNSEKHPLICPSEKSFTVQNKLINSIRQKKAPRIVKTKRAEYFQ